MGGFTIYTEGYSYSSFIQRELRNLKRSFDVEQKRARYWVDNDSEEYRWRKLYEHGVPPAVSGWEIGVAYAKRAGKSSFEIHFPESGILVNRIFDVPVREAKEEDLKRMYAKMNRVVDYYTQYLFVPSPADREQLAEYVSGVAEDLVREFVKYVDVAGGEDVLAGLSAGEKMSEFIAREFVKRFPDGVAVGNREGYVYVEGVGKGLRDCAKGGDYGRAFSMYRMFNRESAARLLEFVDGGGRLIFHDGSSLRKAYIDRNFGARGIEPC